MIKKIELINSDNVYKFTLFEFCNFRESCLNRQEIKKSYARSLTVQIDTHRYGYVDLKVQDAILEYVSSVIRELSHHFIEDGVNFYQISESYMLQMCFRHENIV